MPRREARVRPGDLPEPPDGRFLLATDAADADHPEIGALADRLTGGLDPSDRVGRSRSVFTHVRDALRFGVVDPPSEAAAFHGPRVARAGAGMCIQKTSLAVALARAAGVPAAYWWVTIRDHTMGEEMEAVMPDRVITYHSLLAVHLGHRWGVYDASLPAASCERKGWSTVGFDPDADGLPSAAGADGRPNIEVLAHLGWSLDLPEEVLADVTAFFAGPGGQRAGAGR